MGGTWVGCGRVLDDHSKDNTDFAPRLPRLRTDPQKLTHFTDVRRVQKQIRNHLVTTWTTMKPQCFVNLGESSVHEPPESEFQAKKARLADCNLGPVGWSHARRAKSCPTLDSVAACNSAQSREVSPRVKCERSPRSPTRAIREKKWAMRTRTFACPGRSAATRRDAFLSNNDKPPEKHRFGETMW